MTGNHEQSTFTRWLNAYEAVWGDPQSLATTACPSCGACALHLHFVRASTSGAVFPAMWCSSCFRGLPPVNAVVPGWAEPVDETAIVIPDYTIAVD